MRSRLLSLNDLCLEIALERKKQSWGQPRDHITVVSGDPKDSVAAVNPAAFAFSLDVFDVNQEGLARITFK